MLRLVLWPDMGSVLENVPCMLGKDMHSAAIEWSTLCMAVRSVLSIGLFKSAFSVLTFSCLNVLSIVKTVTYYYYYIVVVVVYFCLLFCKYLLCIFMWSGIECIYNCYIFLLNWNVYLYVIYIFYYYKIFFLVPYDIVWLKVYLIW